MPTFSLNREQLAAVEHKGHILCCACPGSGKTRVGVEKVRHILSSAPDSRIVLITFSRNAARELRDRLRRSLPQGRASRIRIGTFHSIALEQLQGAGIKLKVLGGIEVYHLISQAMAELRVKSMTADEAIERIALCKIDASYAANDVDAARLTKVYDVLLRNQRACDFTDIMVRAVEMMGNGTLPPVPADYMILDEFQDIDRVQFSWLSHHLGQGCKMMAVGDDDQSIYAFRKSLGYRGMMDFVRLTGADVITLDTNYRSTNGIIAAATRLISHNLDRVQKTPIADRGHGLKPRLVLVRDADGQIDHLIEGLDSICTKNPPPIDSGHALPYRFTVKPGQVAVLARTNFLIGDIERKFIEARIPYLRPGRGLFDNAIAKVLLSLLGSLQAQDSIGLEVSLRWAKVPDSTLARLRDIGGGQGIHGLLDEGHPVAAEECPGGPVVREFVQYGRRWTAMLRRDKPEKAASSVIYGACGWMIAVIKETCGIGPDVELPNMSSKRVRDVAWVETFRGLLVELKGSLAQRLRVIRQDTEQDVPRVILSTFHGAKGLEWEHVFLTDVVTGVVPKIEPSACDDEIAEERRVFYVAMTRARDSLTIFSRRGKNDEDISEFLWEADLVNRAMLEERRGL